MQLLSFTSNYKTYAAVVVGLGLAALQVFNPALLARITPLLDSPSVDFGLSLAGLGFLRMGVAKQTKVATDAVAAFEALQKAYEDISAQITVPTPTPAPSVTSPIVSQEAPK